MYGKLIECAVQAVLQPDSYFVWGLSYEVALHYGIINKQMMMDQRNSSTMSEESFARKLLRGYIAIYTIQSILKLGTPKAEMLQV